VSFKKGIFPSSPGRWGTSAIFPFLVGAFFGLVIAVISGLMVPQHVFSKTVTNATTSAGQQSSSPCQMVAINGIALAPGATGNNTIEGEFCNIHSQTVMVMVPGMTYDYTYFDLPASVAGPSFSAVRYMTGGNPFGEAYSTFTLDCLGIGPSSRPLNDDNNVENNAYVVHQIITQLTSSGIGNVSFSHVILVGHSLGSMIVTYEAATYHDSSLAGVILTGSLHKVNSKIAQIAKFVSAGPEYPAGYLTTPAPTIGSLYYAPATSNAAVIAWNEKTVGVTTSAELHDIGEDTSSTVSRGITVPVLEIVGQDDNLMCVHAVDCGSAATVKEEEAPYFSQAAELQVVVIPGTGHDLDLSTSAPETYATMLQWSLLHVAP